MDRTTFATLMKDLQGGYALMVQRPPAVLPYTPPDQLRYALHANGQDWGSLRADADRVLERAAVELEAAAADLAGMRRSFEAMHALAGQRIDGWGRANAETGWQDYRNALVAAMRDEAPDLEQAKIEQLASRFGHLDAYLPEMLADARRDLGGWATSAGQGLRSAARADAGARLARLHAAVASSAGRSSHALGDRPAALRGARAGVALAAGGTGLATAAADLRAAGIAVLDGTLGSDLYAAARSSDPTALLDLTWLARDALLASTAGALLIGLAGGGPHLPALALLEHAATLPDQIPSGESVVEGVVAKALHHDDRSTWHFTLRSLTGSIQVSTDLRPAGVRPGCLVRSVGRAEGDVLHVGRAPARASEARSLSELLGVLCHGVFAPWPLQTHVLAAWDVTAATGPVVELCGGNWTG